MMSPTVDDLLSTFFAELQQTADRYSPFIQQAETTGQPQLARLFRAVVYHAGELNQVLSICRGEAWEEGEEVEENNVSTVGHRVQPPWLDR